MTNISIGAARCGQRVLRYLSNNGNKQFRNTTTTYGRTLSSTCPSNTNSNKPKLKIKTQDVSSSSICDRDDDEHDGDGKRRRLELVEEEEEDDEHHNNEHRSEEAMKKNQQKAMMVTKLGAVANIGLALSKGVVGLAVSSTALIADAANSLGDVLCDAVVYYSVQEARKTATPDSPWGRGKVESIGALSVGGLLLGTGIGIGYSAILAGAEILNLNAVNPLQSIDLFSLLPSGTLPGTTSSSVSATEIAGWNAEQERLVELAALGVSGLSVAAKEVLFRYTLKVGKAANSSAVVANAWQHRADAVASSAVFAGLVGSMLGYPILDPIAGVCVAGLIVKQAVKIGKDALVDLSDAPASKKETDQLRDTCKRVKGVLNVESLLARKSGPFLFVEATIGVDGSISASAAHRISELTKLELLKEHAGRVANAVVHVTPLGSSGLGEQYPDWARDHDFIVAEIKRAVLPIAEIHAVSEVQVYYKDNGLISTKVDILLPPNLTIHQAHAIAVRARKVIEHALPGIGDVDVDLELDEA